MTQAQSNSLGELYVDFKSRGSDVLMKNLRGISADFLLVKTAATQALKPIVSAGKESLQTGLEIGKMSSSLGITAKEYMRLKYYFKTKGLSEGLISDLENLSNQFQDVQRGVGNFSEGMMRAATTLGIDLSQYDGSFQSMEKLLGDIRERTKDWTPLQQKNILRDMGISPEWAYAFEKGATNISEGMLPSNEAVEGIIKANEEIAELSAQMDLIKLRATAKLAKHITPVLEGVTSTVDDLTSTGRESKVKETLKEVAGVKPTYDEADIGRTIIKLFKDNISDNKTQTSATKSTNSGKIAPAFSKASDVPKELPYEEFTPQGAGDVDQISKDLPLLGNAATNNNYNYTINVSNENNITTPSPERTADRIAQISTDEIGQYLAQNGATV